MKSRPGIREIFLDIGAVCEDDGGTNKAKRASAKSGDVCYWVEKHYRDCGPSGIDCYITAMYHPEEDATAAMAGQALRVGKVIMLTLNGL